MSKRPTARQAARLAANRQKMAGQAAASRARSVEARETERQLISSRAALDAVLGLAVNAYLLDLAGTHGPLHWLRVLRNGRELARLTPGADLAVIEHFALLHDCKREDDAADPWHGERAAAYVRSIALQLNLSEAQIEVLAEACAEHEAGGVSDDPTIGCCFDADRLELSRLHRRPIGELLSTTAALLPGLQAAAWRRGTLQMQETL